MRRVARALVLLASVFPLALVPGVAPAQAPVATWVLEGVNDRFCVSYLVEPGQAAEILGSRFTGVAAERVEGLHPAVAQVVSSEPAFRSWVPAEICVIDAGRVSSGQRVASEGGRSVILGYSALAAMPAGGGSPAMRASVFSTSGSLRRLASDQLIHVDGFKYAKGTVPDGTDQRRSIDYEGATLTWVGRILEPSGTPAPRALTLATDGKRNRALAGNLSEAAAWERATVGNLRVQGKSDLARALIASPIRMVGPVTGGGSISVEWSLR